jgi:LPXTG-site transpeptidase (sortase) family protein
VRIPSIGVDSPVVELGTVLDEKGQWVWETPKHAVGHHRGTAGPGEAGNMVLSGHISSPVRGEGNVFAALPRVKLGDELVVETKRGRFLYRVVTRRVVEPDAVDVMAPTEAAMATLITCYPDWVYSHRLVLTAEPLGYQPGDRS